MDPWTLDGSQSYIFVILIKLLGGSINSQYEYSHETFSYKDDLRGGEYLINRIFSKRRNAPLSRICDRSLVFEGAKTGIFEGAKHLKFRHFLIRKRF